MNDGSEAMKCCGQLSEANSAISQTNLVGTKVHRPDVWRTVVASELPGVRN